MEPQAVQIIHIVVEEQIQQRASLNNKYIEDLVVEIADGVKFPPLDVFNIGDKLLLVDGFHRLVAYRQAGIDTVEVNIFEGTEREAILHAVGANADHGLRRTNADKLKAVLTLLTDPDWGQWSDTEIARRCNVTQPFVSNKRNELTQNGYEWGSKRKCADGRIIETSKIGVRTPTEKSIDTWAIEENGSSQTEQETIGIDENEEPRISEVNCVESSPVSGSETVVEMVTSDNDVEILVSDETDESNPTGSEDLPTETKSEQSSRQEMSITIYSTDSGEDELVRQNDGENLPDYDSDDVTGADYESSDQNEEGNSGPDRNDVDGADASTSPDNYEEEPIPASSPEEQFSQEDGEEPETNSNDPSFEEATEHASDDNSLPEPEANVSLNQFIEAPDTDHVPTLKAEIIELKKNIIEKNQRISELEQQVAALKDDVKYYENEVIDTIKRKPSGKSKS